MPEKFSRNTLGKVLENLRHEIIFSDDMIIFYQINLFQNQQLRYRLQILFLIGKFKRISFYFS